MHFYPLDGSWEFTGDYSVKASFHGQEYMIEMAKDGKTGVVTSPKRDPPIKLQMGYY